MRYLLAAIFMVLMFVVTVAVWGGLGWAIYCGLHYNIYGVLVGLVVAVGSLTVDMKLIEMAINI